ncbi:MAG: hypothetical protein AAF614_26850 [Chloroflexota bacterium]
MSELNFEQPFGMNDENNSNTTSGNASQPNVLKQRADYIIFLGLILFFSFIFQAGNLGWMKIIFGLLYLGAFSLHALYWFIWLGKPGEIRPHDKALFFFANLFFLIGNVLNVDFGDVSSYMFFMQYTDPPESLIALGFFASVGWLILLAIDLVIRLIGRAQRKSAEGSNS